MMPMDAIQNMEVAPERAKRATMKDIAEHFGVSINTVHKAISGKRGVSDNLRKRVLSYADSIGYRRDERAVWLRKNMTHVALCLPQDGGSGAPCHSAWQGCAAVMDLYRDSQVVCECVPFAPGGQALALESLLMRCLADGTIDGLLTCAPSDKSVVGLLRAFENIGVPTVIIDGAVTGISPLVSFVPDCDTIGSLMAEQAVNLLRGKPAPRTLLHIEDSLSQTQRVISKSFTRELRLSEFDVIVTSIRIASADASVSRSKIKTALLASPPSMACCASPLGTEALASVMEELDMAGKVLAIGGDLLPENVEALRRGVVSNLVCRDSCSMARSALKKLLDYVLLGKAPRSAVELGVVDLVFRSNLDRYADAARVQIAG